MPPLYNMVETLKYRGTVVKMHEGTVIASGDGNGADEVDSLPYKEASFFLYCSAITTTGGVVVTIQSKNPSPYVTVYEDLIAFTSINAQGGEKKDVSANLGSVLSLKWVFTTTTSFTFSVYAVLKIA